MASGWGPDGAVQDQIDSTVDDAVQRARDALGAARVNVFVRNAAKRSHRRALLPVLSD